VRLASTDGRHVVLLCSGHHAALHDGLLEMHGQAPYEIAFRWVYGPPLPVGLAPEARHALIAERIAQIFAGMLPMTGSSPAADHGTARPGWDGSPVGST